MSTTTQQQPTGETQPDYVQMAVRFFLSMQEGHKDDVAWKISEAIRTLSEQTTALRQGCNDLRADWEAAERRAIEIGDILQRYVLVMRAFMIDAMREAGAPNNLELDALPDSVSWINNTLIGPGHAVPDEALAADGQEWFDAKLAEHEAFRAAHPAPGQPVVGVLRAQVRVLQAQLASVPLAGTKAASDVLAERRRQVDAEGYDHQHDDAHVCDEIAAAACFYALPPGAREWDASSTGYGETLGDAIVPDGWVLSAGSRRRDLVKAGALILAEIERLDRAAALQGAKQ